jgi:hypothetical protein
MAEGKVIVSWADSRLGKLQTQNAERQRRNEEEKLRTGLQGKSPSTSIPAFIFRA